MHPHPLLAPAKLVAPGVMVPSSLSSLPSPVPPCGMVSFSQFQWESAMAQNSELSTPQSECLTKWVCLKMLCSPKPNGFADHYPY